MGIVKYTPLFTKYTPYTTPIPHHNMVCTTNIAPPYICTTTFTQLSAYIVQMVNDLPSKFLLACNRRLKLFPFVNGLTDDPDTLILHPTLYLIHPIHHTHTVDLWCVLICTCAEVDRNKSKIYLALTILLCQCYDMHLNCTATWPCTCPMAFFLPAHLIRWSCL